MTSISPSVLAQPSGVARGPCAFVVLPDTQFYIWRFPEVFLSQMRWIADPNNGYDIRAALHVGDIVHHNVAPEWQTARAGFDLLRAAGVPYLLTTGNHDYGANGSASDRSTGLHDHFSSADLQLAIESGVFEKDAIENSYIVVDTINGPWLLLALELAPRKKVLDWANDVIARHADMSVIVATHAYLYPDGKRYNGKRKVRKQNWIPTAYDLARNDPEAMDGQGIWQNCLRRHPNVRIVVCGHALLSGVAHSVVRGRHGNPVHQLLANYQTGVQPDRGEGGGGYLRILEMAAGSGELHVKTYSPWRNEWLHTPEHEFSIAFPDTVPLSRHTRSTKAESPRMA